MGGDEFSRFRRSISCTIIDIIYYTRRATITLYIIIFFQKLTCKNCVYLCVRVGMGVFGFVYGRVCVYIITIFYRCIL